MSVSTGIVPQMTVQEARDCFLAAFHLDTDGYTSREFPVHLLSGITLRFPNPGLLPLHDLHHVATGYPATLLGEAQISAWELRAGCPSPMVRFLCCGAITLGYLQAPRRVMRAWRAGRGMRSLYNAGIPYETLLRLRVAELRQMIGLPETGCFQNDQEKVTYGYE